jgi:hypothetical protein
MDGTIVQSAREGTNAHGCKDYTMSENPLQRSANMINGILAGGVLLKRSQNLHAIEKEHIYTADSQRRGHLVYQHESDYLIFKVLNNLLALHSQCEKPCQECELIDRYIVEQPTPEWYTNS